MRRSPWQEPVFQLSVVTFVGYYLISRLVLSLFPFSTYSMYSSTADAGRHGDVRSCHLMARGPDGVVCDVNRYRAWQCPADWDEASKRSIRELGCPVYFNVEDPIREHLRRFAGPDPGGAASAPVELVRRRWVFQGNAAPVVTDHPVASCTAVAR